ncbi:MAG: type II toxin-antitoxin system VapC family toxin [Rectinemataceae bacterium]
MRVLLDTCTFLWLCEDSPSLSPTARHLILSCAELYLSPVSAWEIAVKNRIGRLPLPEDPATWVPRMRKAHGIDPLPLTEDAALCLLKLPDHHKDPFDRMLTAQALHEGLVILTPDPLIRAYPVRTEW